MDNPKPNQDIKVIPDSPNDQQDNTQTILQKMYKLQKDIDEIKKIVLQLSRNNPENKMIEVADEFIKIYASEKSKAYKTSFASESWD
ncbi:MAG TPA: hypothetical protein VIO64_05615 [Pseudobacteroides sp.]|uniref:hypothetical protein n=1 Tax=Pseudobacteroides sp. TaxID=1968840 RepID=UPI002F934CB4